MTSGDDYEIRIKMDMAEATSTLVTYEIALRSALRLAKRLGLPDEVNGAITEIQKLIRIVHQLQMAYLLLTSARAAAGDPLAIFQASIAIGSAVITATELS